MPQETEISPGSRSAPRPGLPWVLLLPGGFPNKVREGKVPVIVQPRFHRVLLPRPRGAGARPLHDRAARLCASRVPVPPLLGSLPRAAGSAWRPSPSPRSGRAGFGALLGAGPACSPAPLLRSRLQVRRAGPVPQPAPRWGPAQPGSCSLSSL